MLLQRAHHCIQGIGVVDNAASHLPRVTDLEETVKFMSLSPNTISVSVMFTAMDLLELCVIFCNCRKSYTIIDAITNIQAAWADIMKSTVPAFWMKMWLECVCNSDGFGKPAVEWLCKSPR